MYKNSLVQVVMLVKTRLTVEVQIRVVTKFHDRDIRMSINDCEAVPFNNDCIPIEPFWA